MDDSSFSENRTRDVPPLQKQKETLAPKQKFARGKGECGRLLVLGVRTGGVCLAKEFVVVVIKRSVLMV